MQRNCHVAAVQPHSKGVLRVHTKPASAQTPCLPQSTGTPANSPTHSCAEGSHDACISTNAMPLPFFCSCFTRKWRQPTVSAMAVLCVQVHLSTREEAVSVAWPPQVASPCTAFPASNKS
eukprot:1033649-Pelagomonas_calceolata.AAC.1